MQLDLTVISPKHLYDASQWSCSQRWRNAETSSFTHQYESFGNHSYMQTGFLLPPLSYIQACSCCEARHAATFKTSQNLLKRLKSLSEKVQQSTVFSGVRLNSPYGSNTAQKNPHQRLKVLGCTYRVLRCLTGSFIYRRTERVLGSATHFRVQRGNCDGASITRGWDKAEEMHHSGGLAK